MVTVGAKTNAWAVLRVLADERMRSPIVGGRQFRNAENHWLSACGLICDISRQRIRTSEFNALVELAHEVDMPQQIRRMWAGEDVNFTEGRPALHVALRQPVGAAIGGITVAHQIIDERERMLDFAEKIRQSGRFRDVISLGIGGSDLGPKFVCDAFESPTGSPITVHFVSNPDGIELERVLARCDPKATLFIVCSKSFRTVETLDNARRARFWIEGQIGVAAAAEHFIGVSENAALMTAFGISPALQFKLWPWVGGRFSVWSSVGLSVAIKFGADFFRAFLSGAYGMDNHFKTSAIDVNLPLVSALVGVWNNNFMKIPGVAIIPYSERLRLLPAVLQQVEMESCGKLALVDGSRSECDTAPIVWGGLGSESQHSFFQALHQGALRSSIEFFLVREAVGDVDAHEMTNLQALAQIEALHLGSESSDFSRHYDGLRPVSVTVLDRLEPQSIGALLAMWEHRAFCEACVWGVNAFDQFGVELGKNIFEKARAADDFDGRAHWRDVGELADFLLGSRRA
jgi:glucose-6-phosphate isomerase